MASIIELKDITAGYDRQIVLSHIHLTINEGDFIGIIGPNGGGKTTLLKVILGLLKPFSGKISYPDIRQTCSATCPKTVISTRVSPSMSQKWSYPVCSREKDYIKLTQKQKNTWHGPYLKNTAWATTKKVPSENFPADKYNGYFFAVQSSPIPGYSY